MIFKSTILKKGPIKSIFSFSRLFLLFLVFYFLFSLPSVIHSKEQSETKTLLKVGIYDNSPKIFEDEYHTPAGIFVDILEYIAEKENWKLEYVHLSWRERLQYLKEGKIDLLPDVAYTDKRTEDMDFNKLSVLTSWLQLYSVKGSTIVSLWDLKGKTLVVLKDSNQEKIASDLIDQLKLDCKLITRESLADTVEAVMNGEADVMIADRFLAYKKENPTELIPVPVILAPFNLHFAVTRGFHNDILTAIDRHMKDLINDPHSEYYSSLERWLNQNEPFVMPRFMLIVFVVLSLALVLFAVNTAILKWQVGKRTRELSIKNKALRRAFERVKENEMIASRSLKEKEVLIRELYHRTKNNMSIIMSLIYLKINHLSGKDAGMFLQDIEAQIKSMSLVHELLLSSKDLTFISLREYVTQLVENIYAYRHRKNSNITVNLEIEDISVSIDTAVPLGLVLNELITNSFKHAFPDEKSGHVSIKLSCHETSLKLLFRDDGIGFPPGYDRNNSSSFGLMLLYEVVEQQLQGRVDVTTDNGVSYTITFANRLNKARV